eukprot:768137-Hanusia_phi.AAC.18
MLRSSMRLSLHLISFCPEVEFRGPDRLCPKDFLKLNQGCSLSANFGSRGPVTLITVLISGSERLSNNRVTPYQAPGPHTGV